MTTRRFLPALLAFFMAGACSKSALTPLGNAALVLSEIKLRGAAPVSRRMDSDAKFARSVLDGIASGDSSWLEVARALRPGSSAVEASLTIALAAALPVAPDGVLGLLGREHAAEEVCGIPFLKPTKERVTQYRDSALAAVSAISVTRSLPPGSTGPATADSALLARRSACAAALRSAADRKLARIDPAYVIKNKPVVPKKRPPKRKARRTSRPR